MFGEAGIAEVRTLLARHLPPIAPVMRAIGVREIAAYLHGALTRDEALQAGRAATRQYAKRQYTWFNHQPPAQWPRLQDALEGEAFAAALEMLTR
jgi:tRNA dimethylallyltransferase